MNQDNKEDLLISLEEAKQELLSLKVDLEILAGKAACAVATVHDLKCFIEDMPE